MEQYPNQQSDILRDHRPKELPSTLNVLTILTFIGCAWSYIGTLWGLAMNKNPQEQIDKIREGRDKVGDGFLGRWLDASMEMAQRGEQFKYINVGLTFLFTTLCLVGALQMRKLKKQGFSLYAIGEIVPIPVMFILMGFNLATMVFGAFAAIIAIVFVILYAGQRKYMTNN
ncbi:MAG: hypothetical protein EOO08_13300 [Chitinophagaceae bacterium]|nr:MAG: hypothetical protein EOO08_13300 [Chitinophagaceae bacterium]